MSNTSKKILGYEKRSIFLINLILIILVMFSLTYNISLEYFFYFNIIITFFLSLIFFQKSKDLAKQIIVTNLFIFFYFLYPNVAKLVHIYFGFEGYIFVILYNVLIAYIFLYLSGNSVKFLKNIKKFSPKILFIVILVGLIFGLLFTIIREPIPSLFTNYAWSSLFEFFSFIIFSSFMFAFSEQIIFSGFLFNTYSNLTSKKDAFYQTALIFVLFHLLRFEVLVNHYQANFANFYMLYLLQYYVLLFIFMITALYFYSFKQGKYEGNFAYPLALHFAADFGLFFFYLGQI